MNKPVVIYATFAPEDSAKARSVLEDLQRQRPSVTLVGRQQIGFPAERTQAFEQIQRASITLVLIGRNTFTNEAVRHDLEESRAKRPPNQLLAIYLEEEVPVRQNQPNEIPEITSTGGEVIPAGGDLCAGVERTVQRIDQAERVQREAASPRPSSGCNR